MLRQQFFKNLLEEHLKDTGDASTTEKREEESTAETNQKQTKEQTQRQSSWTYFQRPPVHREETYRSMSFAFDMPGFDVDDLKITVEDHVLSFVGTRRNKFGDTLIVRRRVAINESLFDEQNIQADYSEGVLEITIPKKPEPKARRIEIDFFDPDVLASEQATPEDTPEEASPTSTTEQTRTDEPVASTTVEDTENEEPTRLKRCRTYSDFSKIADWDGGRCLGRSL
jgi:HSP20 family molecular chaperone IbpA